MKKALFRFSSLMILLVISSGVFAQRQKPVEKIRVITRNVEGEVHTMSMDTLVGKLKISAHQDQYITSFDFAQKGKSKRSMSAYDVKKFMQVVPYPDREKFGTDKVYYKSVPHPKDETKKVFVEMKDWNDL